MRVLNETLPRFQHL